MRSHNVVVVLVIGFSLLWGCAEDEAPTAPRGDPADFVMTVQIDSCDGFDSGQPIYEMCGISAEIRASFEFVLADIREEVTRTDNVTKVAIFRSGPGNWEFLTHDCKRGPCTLGDDLHDLFEERPLRIIARRWISPSEAGTDLRVDVVAGNTDVAYALSFPFANVVTSVDAAGFPVLNGDLELTGDFLIETSGGPAAQGKADLTIKNWQGLPVHFKPEPPVVARPTFSAQELGDAPETLEFGNHKLAFQVGEVRRPALDRGISVSVSIWEQGLWDLDNARLDFLWVVHETGEIWEPEIPGAWDSFRMEQLVDDGPKWDVGTDVDIVAGFVDLAGEVWLMRVTDTIEMSLRGSDGIGPVGQSAWGDRRRLTQPAWRRH